MKLGTSRKVTNVLATMWFAVGIAAVTIGQNAAAETFIVEEGRANAEIVIAPDAVRPVELAAEDLQAYIKKISGAELPVRTAHGEAEVKIYVGKSRYTEKLGVEGDGLRHGGFRMVSGPKHLVLV